MDSSLVPRLRRSGLRLSAQRRAIAEALDGTHTHLSADEVLARTRADLPEVGRATVYKALDAFVQTAQVRQLALEDGPTLFDPNGHIDHDHLVCLTCGDIRDIPTLAAHLRPVDERFTVERTEVTHYGRCTTCGPGSAASTGPR